VPADVTDDCAVAKALDQEVATLRRHHPLAVCQVLGERRWLREPEVVELADPLRSPGAGVEYLSVVQRRLAQADRWARLGDGPIEVGRTSGGVVRS
jgi:hypothetical protein